MEFAFERLHHVLTAIPPGGEDLARDFSDGVLGMSEVAKPASLQGRGGCWFRGGGWEVHLGVEQRFVPTEGTSGRTRSTGTATGWISCSRSSAD
jgi:hypothetical protein